jgi:hypothetical protein
MSNIDNLYPRPWYIERMWNRDKDRHDVNVVASNVNTVLIFDEDDTDLAGFICTRVNAGDRTWEGA